MSHFFTNLRKKGEKVEVAKAVQRSRAEDIYQGANPVQRRVIDSIKLGHHYLSIRCPRRSGKSFALTSAALWFGETHPNSRILIISLTLKSTKENFWSGAPGGLFRQNQRYELGLKFNSTDTVWTHQNGARGRLAGAETIADIERLRGAAAEADLAVVDECKSFAPELLNELIRDVLEPGLMTRDGVLILSGTPGSIPVGTFFESTASFSRTTEGLPTCVHVDEEEGTAFTELDDSYKKDLWRLHTWGIQDNLAAPRQWERAINNKKRQGWSDDHPTWRREYLGEWVTDATDLVYSWASYKNDGSVTWAPKKTRDNPSGLDPAQGPWHYVMGLDLGYVDDSALVLCAYSETLKELRHVYDFKSPGLTLDSFFDEIYEVIERYGHPDAIVADTAGGGSKMLIETLNQRYGLGIEPAKKTEKNDHIELVNSDFACGRIKIIPGSDLAHELAGLQWDLSRESKIVLSRTGKLKEDPHCPNHLCDALLYLYRFSYHFWSMSAIEPLRVAKEERDLLSALERRRGQTNDPHGIKGWTRKHVDINTNNEWYIPRGANGRLKRSPNGFSNDN